MRKFKSLTATTNEKLEQIVNDWLAEAKEEITDIISTNLTSDSKTLTYTVLYNAKSKTNVQYV